MMLLKKYTRQISERGSGSPWQCQIHSLSRQMCASLAQDTHFFLAQFSAYLIQERGSAPATLELNAKAGLAVVRMLVEAGLGGGQDLGRLEAWYAAPPTAQANSPSNHVRNSFLCMQAVKYSTAITACWLCHACILCL